MAGKKDLERLRRRKRRKQRMISATVHLFVWFGVAVLYYIGFSIFFDTPFEHQLKHSTDRLRNEYNTLVQRYDTLASVLNNLSERDRNVFRILFESEPYDFDAELEERQGRPAYDIRSAIDSAGHFGRNTIGRRARRLGRRRSQRESTVGLFIQLQQNDLTRQIAVG